MDLFGNDTAPVDPATCAAEGDRALALLDDVRDALRALEDADRARRSRGGSPHAPHGATPDVAAAVTAYRASVNPYVMPDQDTELQVRADHLTAAQSASVESDQPETGVRHAAARLREVVRQMRSLWLDHTFHDPQRAAQYLLTWLRPDVSAGQIAALIGTTGPTLRTWARGDSAPKHPARLTATAQVVRRIHGALTPEGTIAWFHEAQPELGGLTPHAAIADTQGTRAALHAIIDRMHEAIAP